MKHNELDSNSNSIYWVPTAVGAGAGLWKLGQDFRSGAVNPRKWATPSAGVAGVTAREHAMAAGTLNLSRSGSLQFIERVDDMMTNMQWMRLPKDVVHHAVVERRQRFLEPADIGVFHHDQSTTRLEDAVGFLEYFYV